MSQSSPLHTDPAALLAWYAAMGVDEAHYDEPVNRFLVGEINPETIAGKVAAQAPNQQKQPTPPAIKAQPKPVSAQAAGAQDFEEALKEAEKLASECKSFTDLRKALANFEGCGLKRTATNTVFASGMEGAPLMVISAAPGADEDRTGLAFQGITGELLDKMIGAIGFDREQSAYLAHIVPWRPLGNRNPDQLSLAICRPFMMKHIELAKPKAILMLGNAAARSLSVSEELIARMRGKWQMLDINGHECAAMPTYHPDYLLKHPRYKRDSWQDLLALKEKLKAMK